MAGLNKFYKKSRAERLATLQELGLLSEADVALLQQNTPQPNLGDSMIENFVGDFHIPQGLVTNLLVNDRSYLVPLVTEEPSVIAAASHGAALVRRGGGFQAFCDERLMIGQIVLTTTAAETLTAAIMAARNRLLAVANAAHPSLVKRGGGARWLRVRQLAADLLSVDIAVDVQAAMGANMLNTMLEAVKQALTTELHCDAVMAILSNYATASVVTATCRIPVSALAKNGEPGATVAEKIALASRVAQLDEYRATTHNKGIMNGIDAAVIASGNDWRAVEAGAHAYAARSGKYRGLSQWHVHDDELIGTLALPLALGTVGGSIKIVPQVQLNHRLLAVASPTELATVIAAVGLAQNLAALLALVTEGIQRGHMKLQLRSLALACGARPNEVAALVAELEKVHARDSATAKQILQQLRANRSHE